MLKYLLLLICGHVIIYTGINAQFDTVPRTEEYAMVRVVVYYEGGFFARSTSRNPNPTLTIGNKTTDFRNYLNNSEGEDFKSIPEMLDYMNKWGWTLVTSNTMEYLGAGVQNDESRLNTNKYIQILIFKRAM